MTASGITAAGTTSVRTDPSAPVLVGIPMARSSRAALDWAAAQAAASHRPLQILCAVRPELPAAPWHPSPDPDLETDLLRFAHAAVTSAVAHVRATWPDIEVDGQLVRGAPADLLVDHSSEVALTVVGTRQLSALGGIVLGSVSSEVAARASSTVVVVTGPGALPEEDAAIVVGVDPYARDDSALLFAFAQASTRGRKLEAILCWRPDPLAGASWVSASAAPERANRWLSEALAGWREEYPDVRVSTGVVRDHVVDGLVSAAHGQDLLVVGAGTRHPRIGGLLGSVTQGVLHHATCPVAVVH